MNRVPSLKENEITVHVFHGLKVRSKLSLVELRGVVHGSSGDISDTMRQILDGVLGILAKNSDARNVGYLFDMDRKDSSGIVDTYNLLLKRELDLGEEISRDEMALLLPQ